MKRSELQSWYWLNRRMMALIWKLLTYPGHGMNGLEQLELALSNLSHNEDAAKCVQAFCASLPGTQGKW